AANAVGPHRFEHVEGGQGILFEILAGMVQSKAHIGVGREVKNDIVPGDDFAQALRVEEISLHELETWLPTGVFEESGLAGREVIVHRDRVPFGEQPIRQIAADKASPAGNERTHHATSASTWAGL